MAPGWTTLRRIPLPSLRIGAYWTAGYLVFSGVLTVLVPNALFIRMTPIVWVDYILWPLSAILIGGFMTLRHAMRQCGAACTTTAGAGGLAAFLGFSCPVCNKVLLLLLGTGGVLTFIEPYRTWIGLGGVALLMTAFAVMARAYGRTHGTIPVQNGLGDDPRPGRV